MKLICVQCGNYTHFEAAVESLKIITVSPRGILAEDNGAEGFFDGSSWIRMGLVDLVEYCIKQDLEALQLDSSSMKYINPHISCARCGSNRVCVPYREWSPPKKYHFLDDEIHDNRQEFAWLRKERLYADSLPVLR